MTRFLTLLALLWASPAFAPLPHGIPDFCAGSPDNVAAGQTVTLAGAVTKGCLGIHGSVTVTGALLVDTILVYADGALTVQPGASIVFRDFPLDPVGDPEQWSHGLIGFGSVTMIGPTKTPFVRAAGDLVAGQTTLPLVATWAAGDRLFIPDTRQVRLNDWFNAAYVMQHERVTIATVGAALTLASPLAFDHRGARNADGTLTALLPHVANLTRSIVVRSQNPAGVRGALVFVDRANVSITGVAFRDLGRTHPGPLDSYPGPATNQIGRYAVHFHHYKGPVNPTNTGYQFRFVGNVIEDTRKWPLTIHASHFGLIQDNVIVGGSGLTGAGIAFEDGSETDNLVQGNFVGDIRGNANPRDSGGPLTANGTAPGSAGECIWGVGFNNRFVANVVTGCRNPMQQVVSGVGFKFAVPSAIYHVQNPTVRGADLTQMVDAIPQCQPLREFRDNEAYGGIADGLTLWQLGIDGGVTPCPNQPESVIANFTVWHAYESALWLYPTNRLTVDHLVQRIAPDDLSQVGPASINSGDYRQVDLTLRNADLHTGVVFGGTDYLGTIAFLNNRATTHGSAFNFQTPATPGTVNGRTSGVTFTLTNNVITPWPGRPLKTMQFWHATDRTPFDTVQPLVVTVNQFQGSSLGASFRAYFPEQATQNIYGGVAPCADTTTRPSVIGITCSTEPVPPPPPVDPDTDGDGVKDSIDACAGTPPSTPVNPSGCPIPIVVLPPPPPPPPPVVTLIADVATKTCSLTATDSPPMSDTGWKVQFRYNGVSLGNVDTSAPYTRATTVNVGSYAITATWTKTGQATVTRTTSAECQ